MRDLRFEIGNLHIPRLNRGLVASEALGEQQQILPGVGERPLALAHGRLPFALPQGQRMRPNLIFRSNFLQPLTRRSVIVLGSLLSQRECLLPQGRRGIGEVGRQAGEGGGVPGVERRLIFPKLLHCLRNRGGRAAFQFVSNRGDGRVAAGAHQMPGGALDVGVGDARAAFARFAVLFVRRVVGHGAYRTMIHNGYIVTYTTRDKESYPDFHRECVRIEIMELTHQTAESSAAAITGVDPKDFATPAEKVRAWWRKARRVYPEATLRAWRFDWAVFLAFCKPRDLSPLPASPATIAAFIADCGAAAKKPATIRRYLSTIATAHRAAKIPNPNDDEDVKLALKALQDTTPKRQRQAKALGWHEIKRFLITAGVGIRADRERALLCVAYDTMARRREVVAMDVEDFAFMEDGSGRVIIRRSKTDQTGEGALAYLSPDTVAYLQAWLKASGINSGAVFRRLIGRGRIGPRLQVDAIAQTFKRVAEFVGMTEEEMRQVSGHSIRVGATQDMLALNIDLASVMQSGRWKTTVMPMRYGEKVQAGRGGMARTARAQGRSK